MTPPSRACFARSLARYITSSVSLWTAYVHKSEHFTYDLRTTAGFNNGQKLLYIIVINYKTVSPLFTGFVQQIYMLSTAHK